ncbi:Tyrosine-protein phosphatase DSP1 [Phytophthora citrophthora]|uniref:diphosphoinositol-polyphosphate diphosphatase n=1 Tax=Phytophthora citrophthora TaxID=4793 RepID=A0AAD9GVL5_9STRA|nr:Tyrosine-protein phosphatase DSP1 [Phytophthora citrophthora]
MKNKQMTTLLASSVVLAGDPSRVKAVEEEDGDYEELIPPENFAMIEKGLYRSGFPKKKNFAFLKKSLQLKSILTLVLEDYPLANSEFNKMHGITLLQFGVPGNKEPFVDIPEDGIVAALKAVLDKRNHPMLIHCNKGKHRTGCLVGSLRKVQRWAFSSIFDEYIRFSAPKPRMMDQQFIELFKTERVTEEETLAEHLPNWPGL